MLQVAAQQTVTVQVVTTDRYGRTVGEVVLPDGRSLNQEVVRAGYAWWYRQYSATMLCWRRWSRRPEVRDEVCGRRWIRCRRGRGGGCSETYNKIMEYVWLHVSLKSAGFPSSVFSQCIPFCRDGDAL